MPISEINISSTHGQQNIDKRSITYPKLGIKYHDLRALGHDVVACSGLEEVSIHIVFPQICWKTGILNKSGNEMKIL